MAENLVLNVREAAEALRISPHTIYLYIRQGKIAATRIGRRVLVEPSELHKLIDEGKAVQAERSS